MPRNMSFMLTPDQILEQSKTMTRRFGWWFAKPGDIYQPVRQAMGLKKGQKVQRLGPTIRVLSARPEPLYNIDRGDLLLEGFPNMTPQELVEMMMRHAGVESDEPVNRIEFEYTAPPYTHEQL